ncbi:MAG: glycosyltransferase family 2 protein [Sulfurisoma sp.]|nr:glycosyltransferase family 2 protein [Sulfurisoma sp.]
MPRHCSITVIVVNWNAGHWLAKTVSALRRQTFAGFRVIIVDNASTDDSLALALDAWPAVEILAQEKNLGFAVANNLAVRYTDSEWIALLNPDAAPEEDWLARLFSAARDNPDFQFFGSRQLMADDPERLDGIGDAYHVSGLAWRVGHGDRDTPEDRQTREIFAPCAAAAFYRRDAFLQVGGFDPGFFCYLEDVDLGFRLRLAGFRALYVPDAVVAHAGSAITGRMSDFTVYHSQRNLVWVFFKNMPGKLFWRYLPIHLLLNIWAIVRFALRDQGMVVLRAKRDALRGLPGVLRGRARIQSARKVGAESISRLLVHGWPRRPSAADVGRGQP